MSIEDRPLPSSRRSRGRRDSTALARHPGRLQPGVSPSVHLCGNPAGDGRPLLFQRVRAHEEPDVAAGYRLLHDLIARCAEVLGGTEHLRRCRDVVGRAREQVGRAGDVVKIEPAAQADEFALGQPVLLEVGDDLEAPAPRQVDRVLLGALRLWRD